MCSSFFQNGEQINLSHKWNSRSLPHTDIHTAIHIFLALLSWKKYLPLNQHVIFHICNSAEWFYWIVSKSKNMQLSYNLVLLVQLYNFVHIIRKLLLCSITLEILILNVFDFFVGTINFPIWEKNKEVIRKDKIFLSKLGFNCANMILILNVFSVL